MQKKLLLARKQEIERQNKEWLSYELDFGGKKPVLADPKSGSITSPKIYFEKIVSCISDFSKKPLSDCSILDLGCLEGLSSFTMAKHGAKHILGVEGRKTNFAKAQFASEVLGFDNVTFKNTDLRRLKLKTKSFDVVLALGILYHFDAPDVFHLVEKIFAWTKSVAIIDTHFAYVISTDHSYRGKKYSGLTYAEWLPYETSESSIGNKQSFWFSRHSLFNLLTRVGFTGIYECRYPRGGAYRDQADRMTLILTKNPRPKTMAISEELAEVDHEIIAVNRTNSD